MKSVKILPLEHPIDREITLHGCLSYTIRAMALGAMTDGKVKIANALKSDDTYVMFNALKKLGILCEEGHDFFVIEGNLQNVKEANYEINVGLSGRSGRMLIAMLCIVPGTKILTCEEGFKKRPVGDLVDGLLQMGARIEYLEKEGYLPVKIISSKLHGGKIKLRGEISSQFVSAILMIAPLVGEIEIEVVGSQVSKPFIDMTIEAMKSFGVRVINNNYREYFVAVGQSYVGKIYYVEPDAISASYFWGIAALTQSRIKILHLSPKSVQGDVKFADILGQMGCVVRKNAEEQWIEVEGTDILRGISVDMRDMPDTVQTLAVTAAFAQGRTEIAGLGNLKVKETDRIEAPKKELEKMGVRVESGDDSLIINGCRPHGAVIDTYWDHRMAMAFAIAGARIPGVVINDPGVVSKSFPGFWKKMEEIGVVIARSEERTTRQSG